VKKTVKKNLIDENNTLKKDIIIAKVKSQYQSTDAWCQPLMDSIEHCTNLG
jgi:hypothetical protein